MSSSPIISAYFGVWKTNTDWHERCRADTPFNQINRLIIAFAKIVQDKNQKYSIAIDGPEERVYELVGRVKKENPSAKILLALGDSPLYPSAAGDPDFPLRVSEVLQKFGVNGLDIDWESDVQSNALNTLVSGLASQFKSDYQITFDGGSTAYTYLYDLPFLKAYLTTINIMAYGATTNIDACVQTYTNAGFPSQQLVVNIDTEFNSVWGVDTLGSTGSIASKAQYALANIAGLGNWRMCNDYAFNPFLPNFPSYAGTMQMYISMTTTKR